MIHRFHSTGRYRILALFAILCMVISSTVMVRGKTLSDRIGYQSNEQETDRLFSAHYYSTYLQEVGVQDADGSDVIVDLWSYKGVEGTQPESHTLFGRENVMVWGGDCQQISWDIQVESAGLYELWIDYLPYQGNGLPVIRGAMIDGEYLYDEAMNFTLNRFWQDEGAPKVNNLGDEVLPAQKETVQWSSKPMMDSQGKYASALKMNLTEGTHTLTLVYVDQPVAISGIRFQVPQPILPYEQVLKQYRDAGYTNATKSIRFEAEDVRHINYKSDSGITMVSSSKTNASPTSLTSRLYNAIGGYSWRKGNDTIEWNFSVPENGLYKIALRIRQNFGNGLSTTRQIAIDGEVPFEELLEYTFAYNDNLTTHVLQNADKEPLLVYLTAGEHTLSMTAKLGDMTRLLHTLTDITEVLSTTVRNVTMITGQNPDINYDYELEKSIPSLLTNIAGIIESLESGIGYIGEMTAKTTSIQNNLVMLKDQLSEVYQTPRLIPRRLGDLNSSLTSLGDWLSELKEVPLTLDYIEFAAPDTIPENKKESLFDRFLSLCANVVLSFTKDYDAIGSIGGSSAEVTEVLDLWISRGEEWCEILKELVDSQYTPESRIGVRINILPSGTLGGGVNPLLLAINAGSAPDVAMGLPSTIPVEYAIRKAMYDLSTLSGFSEFKQNYLEESFVPLTYESGIYGVPETINFRVLFYRTDIFRQLNLKLPDTWDDVYNSLLPALYQYNMGMHLPAQYDMFIYQNGGNYYTGDGYKTLLGSVEAYNGINQLIKNYTDYGIPFAANFFNRMRTGEMPVGIGDFSLYMQLTYGAPELTGKWSIAPIPGTRQADGGVDRSVGSLIGTATAVLQGSEKVEQAWDFIKWYSQYNVQVEYGRQLESRIGTSARWNTANIQAFKSLPWNYNDLKTIEQSWRWARETPVVLGSYFTARHLGNALTRCVVNNETVRDSLEEAVKQIDKELKRKQESYGIFVN